MGYLSMHYLTLPLLGTMCMWCVCACVMLEAVAQQRSTILPNKCSRAAQVGLSSTTGFTQFRSSTLWLPSRSQPSRHPSIIHMPVILYSTYSPSKGRGGFLPLQSNHPSLSLPSLVPRPSAQNAMPSKKPTHFPSHPTQSHPIQPSTPFPNTLTPQH